MSVAATLRAQAAVLLALADSLEGSTDQEVFDAKRPPPGAASWRAVLEAGRRGEVEVTRVGRGAVVTAAAWKAYVERRRGPRTRPAIEGADESAFAQLGIVVPIRARGRH